MDITILPSLPRLKRKTQSTNMDGLTKARGNTLRKDGTKANKTEAQILPQIKLSSIYKGLKNLWSNSIHLLRMEAHA